MDKDEIVEQIKSTLYKIALQESMSYLVGRFPFFSLPIVNPIFSLLIGKVIRVLIFHTEIGIFYVHRSIIEKDRADAFKEAAEKNEKAQASGTEEEKEKAKKELIDAARALIKFVN